MDMITIIVKSTLLKFAFGYSCFLGIANFVTPENTQASDFLDTIISAIPSQIAGWLGVIYGVAIVFKKVSEAWKSHHINRYDVKTAREKFEQEEVKTDIKRKEL